MDTGFNYYHGADPSEYDIVVSNSEGGLAERCSRSGPGGPRPSSGAPIPSSSPRGRSRSCTTSSSTATATSSAATGWRRWWASPAAPRRSSSSRSAAATSRATPAARGSSATFRSTPSPRRSPLSRINLNITRRSHASVSASSSCRPFELAAAGAAIVSNPYEGIERWFEPGQELLVVNDADEALAAYRELLGDPAQAEAMGARARERVLDEHTYAHRARQLLSLVGPRCRRRGVACRERRRLAIVPARNEEEAVGRVVEELRAFDSELDVRRDQRRLRATRPQRARRSRRRRRCQPPVQSRDRRRRSDRLQVRARARL